MGNVLGFILAFVLIVAVAIPVSNSIIASQNFTGITATIMGLVPLFLALGAMYLAAVTFLGVGR
jgi:hypothetical protein